MNLKEIRALAELIDRHPSTVFRWIKGSRGISIEDAKKLEIATGVSRMAWLYPDENKNPYMPEKYKGDN